MSLRRAGAEGNIAARSAAATLWALFLPVQGKAGGEIVQGSQGVREGLHQPHSARDPLGCAQRGSSTVHGQ